jgi:hypothetical protein
MQILYERPHDSFHGSMVQLKASTSVHANLHFYYNRRRQCTRLIVSVRPFGTTANKMFYRSAVRNVSLPVLV